MLNLIKEFQKKLSANAVAYVNMDTVLKGLTTNNKI